MLALRTCQMTAPANSTTYSPSSTITSTCANGLLLPSSPRRFFLMPYSECPWLIVTPSPFYHFYHVLCAGALTVPGHDFTSHAVCPDHGLRQRWRLCGHKEAAPRCTSSSTISSHHLCWYQRFPSRPLELKNEAQGDSCFSFQHSCNFISALHTLDRKVTKTHL